jgi:hypothetical protein
MAERRGGIIGVMTDVTQILSQIERSDPAAAERLLPLIYDELRKLAAAKLSNEKPGQTLQAAALVHEAYLQTAKIGNSKKSRNNSTATNWATWRKCLRRRSLIELVAIRPKCHL